MKILVVTQYFWPENFKINDLSIGLKERGHEVVILTGKPNYPEGSFYPGYSFSGRRIEFWNGIKICRTPLFSRGSGRAVPLFLNYFSFAFFASLKVFFLKEKFDCILVYQPSPITVGIPAIVAKFRFKAPIYFWVQDLWPESLSAAGGITNKLVLWGMNQLTKTIYKYSFKILVQSKGFTSYITKQGVSSGKIVYFPNYAESFYKIEEKEGEYLNMLPVGFKIMFAGNIGEAQSFNTLVEAAKILDKEKLPVKWVILGDGRMKAQVSEKIREYKLETCFFLLGSYPSEKMPFFFSCADALIVSLKKNAIFALTIPAKIQSYLACGKPIIGSLDGEGARIINEAKVGFASQSEDSVALAHAIREMFQLPDSERKTFGENARVYFEQEFEREKLLNRFELILQKS